MNPEHNILTKSYPKLVICIKQSPTDVAVQLKPYGILSDRDWAFATNPQHEDDLKAIRIVDVVVNQVKINPGLFHTFVSALEAAGPWTKTTVTELMSSEPSLHRHVSHSITPSLSISQNDDSTLQCTSSTNQASASLLPPHSYSDSQSARSLYQVVKAKPTVEDTDFDKAKGILFSIKIHNQTKKNLSRP